MADEEITTADSTEVKPTGIQEVDDMLVELAAGHQRDNVSSYVYGNLIAVPPLQIANEKRARYKCGSYEYSLNDLDIAWLTRALMGECGSDKSKVTLYSWTLFNRYMRWYHNKFEAFWLMLRAFSQPINPNFSRTGAHCRPGGEDYKDMKTCSPEQLDRRDLITYGPLNETVQKYVEMFATGKLLPQYAYVDFGHTPFSKQWGSQITVAGKLTNDYFLTRDQLKAAGTTVSGYPVMFVGMRDYVPTIDTGNPLPYDQLVSYLRVQVAAGQRAMTTVASLTRSKVVSEASQYAEASSQQTTQQVANAAGTTIAMAGAEMTTPKEILIAANTDLQVGADDSW